MKPTGFKRVYFIGIGGIGMSALAHYFLERGTLVAGFDRAASRVTANLEAAGAQITFEADTTTIPEAFRSRYQTLIVYTPAVATTNPLYQYFLHADFDMRKRALVLAQVANAGRCIAVAGTHGKTTTSSLVAHLLHTAKRSPIAFLGGIANNFNSNFLSGKGPEIVVEADEFDRSFLHLQPSLAVITSNDADHLDIYGDGDALKRTFQQFAQNAEATGTLISKYGLGLPGLQYSITAKTDFYATNIRAENGSHVFDLHLRAVVLRGVRNGIPGIHNVENAVAAAAIVYQNGGTPEEIRHGLETFSGVWRRFDVRFRDEATVYIDDYAHHPTEIDAFLKSVRSLYPGKRLTAVFQPHLFSRTRDFMDDFARVLGQVDQLRLVEIYPAREESIPGITALELLKKVQIADKGITTIDTFLQQLYADRPEILVTMGAGDIDKWVTPIEKQLETQ